MGKPRWQAERIRIAIRNLTCRRLIVDEIGYDDLDQIESCANLGVRVFCTLHGDGLRDAVNNALYEKLFGLRNGKRTGKQVRFRMCLEPLEPERWVLYPNLTESVDDVLARRGEFGWVADGKGQGNRRSKPRDAESVPAANQLEVCRTPQADQPLLESRAILQGCREWRPPALPDGCFGRRESATPTPY